MQLATVRGRVTTTIRHASMAAVKLLICQPLDRQGRAAGDPVLAVDQLGAGAGDKVILTSDGKGIRQLLNHDKSPVRWWTMGIVDDET